MATNSNVSEESHSEDTESWANKERLGSLIDGVFAISMTLLIFSLMGELPVEGEHSNSLFLDFLVDMISGFIMYGLAFFILAIFWKVHHVQFSITERVDPGLFWMKIVWLFLTVMIPFSSSFASKHGDYFVPMAFFHLNLFVISFFLFLSFHYSSRRGLLKEGLDPSELSHMKKRFLVFPVFSLLAVLFTLVSPAWSSIVYLFIPTAFGFMEKQRQA